MKTLILSAAAAVALTAPAFADVSTAQEHFLQSEEGMGRIAAISSENTGGNAAAVAAHFAQDYETGDGPRVIVTEASEMVLSTSNNDLASYVAKKLETDTSFLD